MLHGPDFSSSDEEGFSDDPDYYDFKEKMKQINSQPRELSLEEKAADAITYNDLDLLKEQLDKGLDLNKPITSDGWPPLMLAVTYGRLEFVKELINRGADVNISKDGCTCLMKACSIVQQCSQKECLEIIQILVENGANVQAIDRKRMTPFMMVAANGNLEAVKFLMPLSDKNALDNQKWNALFWAVNGNHLETVKYLISEDIQMDIMDVRCQSIIDLARCNDYYEILELFEKEDDDGLAQFLNEHNDKDFFSKVRKNQRPRYFSEICDILYSTRTESNIRLIADKNLDLLKFLSANEEDLIELGIYLPFHRRRIMGALYKFHKQPFQQKSVHIVAKNDFYSTNDVAIQITSAIRQITVMEASLKFILKNSKPITEEKESKEIANAILNVRKRIEMLKKASQLLVSKSQQWEQQTKPADLITRKSRKFKLPWLNIITLTSICGIGFFITVKLMK